MLVHMSFNFPDLPEIHAEAEVNDFSRVLKPMGYMPLTGEHNMGAISAAWHRDRGRILRDAQDERERERESNECMQHLVLVRKRPGSFISPAPGHLFCLHSKR